MSWFTCLQIICTLSNHKIFTISSYKIFTEHLLWIKSHRHLVQIKRVAKYFKDETQSFIAIHVRWSCGKVSYRYIVGMF
jgi:hypothetical protein